MCQSSCEQREKSERNTHTPAPVMSVTPHADTESVVSPPSVKEEFDKTSSGKWHSYLKFINYSLYL